VVPFSKRKNRKACRYCHAKKIKCSLKTEEDDGEKSELTFSAKPKRQAPKPRHSEEERRYFPIRRTRGAVARAELEELRARVQTQDRVIKRLVKRSSETYWGVRVALQILEERFLEAGAEDENRRNIVVQLLSRLGNINPDDESDNEFESEDDEEPPWKRQRVGDRPKSPSPEEEDPTGLVAPSETSEDRIRRWREEIDQRVRDDATGAEKPQEEEDVDMEMESAVGEVGPVENAEKAPEVQVDKTPTLQEIAESAPEVPKPVETATAIEETAGTGMEEEVRVEEIAERAQTVVDTTVPSTSVVGENPVVTPKVEEAPPVIPAGDGLMWAKVPIPVPGIVKTEETPRTIPPVPISGPGTQKDDPIVIDDDDDEMVVDPPAAGKEGGSS
jgi:hypothetical protein